MDLIDGLLSMWEFEESSGTRYDSHGLNNLSDINTVPSHTGKVGNAAQFTSTNFEYLEITNANQTGLNFGDTDFTIAIWAYLLTNTGYRFFVTKGSNESGYQYALDFLNSQGTRFYCDNGTTLDIAKNTALLSTNTWHYVVGWHDHTANTVNLQINNGTIYSTAHSGGVQSTVSPFRVGAFGSSTGELQFMNGYLDQACIWNKVLSSDERTAMYNSGAGLSYAQMLETSFIPKLFWM